MLFFFILSNHCIISDLSNFNKKKNATIVIKVLCSRAGNSVTLSAEQQDAVLTSLWPERWKATQESPAWTACDYALSVVMPRPRDAADKLVSARPGTTCDHSARTVSKQERVCARLPQIKHPTERNRGELGITGGLFCGFFFKEHWKHWKRCSLGILF